MKIAQVYFPKGVSNLNFFINRALCHPLDAQQGHSRPSNGLHGVTADLATIAAGLIFQKLFLFYFFFKTSKGALLGFQNLC
jgi:hypothetical protein